MKPHHIFETIAVYAAYGFFRVLPLDWASNLGGFIGRAVGPRLGATETARANLAAAGFADIENIIEDMWDNIGRTAAEYAHLRRIWERVALTGGEYLDKTRETKTAAIYCAAHLGNWELPGLAAGARGVPIHLVYRKPNNPGVDGLLRHAREAGAAGHIEKGMQGAREIVAVLRSGGAVGILADQKLREGIPVPFFGRPAMTAPALATLALKFGCPVYPARIERLGRACKFKMTIYPPLAGATPTEMMANFNKMLEDWIRARPGQWLWIHRRWA